MRYFGQNNLGWVDQTTILDAPWGRTSWTGHNETHLSLIGATLRSSYECEAYYAACQDAVRAANLQMPFYKPRVRQEVHTCMMALCICFLRTLLPHKL